MLRVERYLRGLTALLNTLAIVALLVILGIMAVDIVLRYTMQITILGAYEIIEYLLVLAIAFCLSHTEMLDSHVKVSMLTCHFGQRGRAFVRCAGYLLQSAMLFFVMVANLEQATAIMNSHEASAIHRIPAYPFYYVIAVGFGVFALALLFRAAQMLLGPGQSVQNIERAEK